MCLKDTMNTLNKIQNNVTVTLMLLSIMVLSVPWILAVGTFFSLIKHNISEWFEWWNAKLRINSQRYISGDRHWAEPYIEENLLHLKWNRFILSTELPH